MTYFQNIKTQDELKTAYRKLCKLYHPDKGGTTEQMQAINNEYERLTKNLLSGRADDVYGEGKFYKTRQEEEAVEILIREAIEKIAHLDGLDIEIIGAWVWVSGDTRTHKDALKAAGYWWMNKKQMWVFKGKASGGRGNTSMDEIRAKYGSEKVSTGRRAFAAA